MSHVMTLEDAARAADIDSLYTVIAKDPNVLQDMDSVEFVETPLHIAASLGHLQFAAEIMDLKPSFSFKRNPQGLTPIHLALQNNHKTVALRLVDINKDLVRAKMRGGFTALHMASQSGDVDLLTKFLEECPDSIEDVTVASETALHLAVKYQQFPALEFLVKWLKKKSLKLERTILNRKDEAGNSILHIAVINNATEAIELLIKHTKFTMDMETKNLMGLTPLDTAGSADVRRKLVRAGAITTIMRKIIYFIQSIYITLNRTQMSEEYRNASLVVATLVATTIYQAALSPPGGLHQIDVPTKMSNNLTHSPSNSTILEGKSVLPKDGFILFSTTNMSAFLASILTIIALLPRSITWLPLYISTFLLASSYYVSMTAISPISTTFLTVSFVVFGGILSVKEIIKKN